MKTTMGDILKALCEEVPVSEKNNRPITYKQFKAAMLSAELFSTRDSIKIRWEQLYNKFELLSERGVIKSSKQEYIVLDFMGVNRVFAKEGIHIIDLTDDESARVGACGERETEESQ